MNDSDLPMQNYGSTTVHEFIGDTLIYRNLAPQETSLPTLAQVRRSLGLPDGPIPRKHEPEYAHIIAHLLKSARRLQRPATPLKRLVYVGDTRLLDGTAFENICKAEDWPGMAFIGSEKHEPAAVESLSTPSGRTLFLSNRWAALGKFDRACTSQGMHIDEETAILIDIDKTALGARGRNDKVIDGARNVAVQQTVSGLLGELFDYAAFQEAYQCFNQTEFHPFTSDNQDYVAYLCLILGSGFAGLEQIVSAVRKGKLTSFEQFINQVESHKSVLPAQLGEMHAQIYAGVRQGDPTPFKTFRRREYIITHTLMEYKEIAIPIETLLESHIVLTQEVRMMALEWKQRGALLFGLSDKPDEAATPTPALAAKGWLPLHRVLTCAVGE